MANPQFEFLKQVPLFSGLPEGDLESLCESVDQSRLASGEVLFTEGSPGDIAYVVMEGQLEVSKDSPGGKVLLNILKPGDVVGEMALLENNPRMATVSARSDSVLIAITRDQMDHLLNTSLPALRAMFDTVLGRWRATEAMLRQGEKMAQLGTLTAGVAHELNNPAAAVRRGADQVQDAITRYATAQAELRTIELTAEQQRQLEDEGAKAIQAAGHPTDLDAMARSDQEYEIETWLEGAGVEAPWELAPALVDVGHDPDSLSGLADRFGAASAPLVVGWLAATYSVHNLLAEIGQGAGRISDIVQALKSYAYLDQAPVQEVDVHEGIDNTLIILRSKLKTGIEVRREYDEGLPRIQAHGSELNQVWTNLIDNAADALDGKGHVTIRSSHDDESVTVEVEDDGPGIPEEIQPRVFDAFFTTKPPGKGTGLGLDISYNIVTYKHQGSITVESQPGRTVFTVRLPINPEA